MPTVRFVGLSGPTSSGKTTLACLLYHIFPQVSYILHADDFSKEFDDIPVVNGYLDADGPAAVDYIRMEQILKHMKMNEGMPPETFRVGRMRCSRIKRESL